MQILRRAVIPFFVLFPGTAPAQETPAPGDHWAFQPVSRPEPPAVARLSWPESPIDRFILARLEDVGLEPSPAATRGELIRRLTFDLIGLPPSPEEVSAFAADDSPDAASRLVDRLLASPYHGERWGRHWLDIARYADNKGYVFFEEKTYPWAWTFRDYVVRALNEDKPFDRFILEQLAADRLPPGAERAPLAALGFLTVGDHFSNNIHDILDDRIDVVTRGLLGLTVTCARCHDHKYDPISMADYYALYGVFRSSVEPMVPPPIGLPEHSEVHENHDIELCRREWALRRFVETKHGEIVRGARTRLAEYLETAYAQRHQPLADNFMLLADPGDLNPSVIHRWRVFLDRTQPSDPVWGPWLKFASLDAERFAEAARAVHAGLQTLPASALNARVRQAFAGDAPASMREVARRYAALLEAVEREHAGGPGLALRATDPAFEELYRVLHGPDAPPDVPAQLDWGFLSLLPDRASQGEFQKLLSSLESWLMSGPGAPARAMSLDDAAVPYGPRIFQRGNPHRAGAAVPRRFLAVLDPLGRPFAEGSGRLELARAIADPRNSLTARVIANRVWQHHFGAGLVPTPSDFGLRSEPPSHRELLDWLALELVAGEWSLKRLHRQILGSAAFAQSSIPGSSAAAAVDPANRLLGRANRRRQDFETQRDSLLHLAGKLDSRVGGPPVDVASRRRAIYAFVNRLDVPPLMTTFDVPNPSVSCAERGQTTVAPQALYFMNNEFVATCAAAIARRHVVSGASLVRAVERLHAHLFGRSAGAGEVSRAAAFLGQAPDAAAWQNYVHALLMTNELVFVD